ncbi:DUF7848 domain-containing protein [Streptomyces marincola]|uniref:DUF7848 domain-containing protein n=1 Tax=Streptomyces marincola TaxID=2878388 RepID=A0A1W7CUA6_9ACTN|nr:hypothetical protein [Streptomyces marincola]ARQ68381.1 hypothetical protein CAG99_05540 [Streptomyces marincola]
MTAPDNPEWVLREGRAEGIGGVVCLGCAETSGWADYDPRPAGAWAIEHTRRNGPAHGRFVVTAHKAWRVDRAASGGGPVAVAEVAAQVLAGCALVLALAVAVVAR